jgi:hypothetical protein
MFQICSQCQQQACSVPGASCCRDCSNANAWLFVQMKNPGTTYGQIDTSMMHLPPYDVDKEWWKKYYNSKTDEFIICKPVVYRN